MQQRIRSVIFSSGAICLGLSLAACGSERGATPSGEGSRSDSPSVQSYPLPNIDEILTDEDVDKLILRRNLIGGPLTDEEVSLLVAAAKRGVLSAYFALEWHHSTDGDPAEAERWFREGVAKGEPNLLVLQGAREKAQAQREIDPDKKIPLLTSAKADFEKSLLRASRLTVASPQTVREDLADVERVLSDARSQL